MLKLAKALTGVTMVLLLFLLVVVYGVNPIVTLTEFSVEPASARSELAQELIEIARRDDMASDLFKRPTQRDLSDYKLITIRIDVRNMGVLPAEWMQLRVVPETGDVALFPSDAVDVPAFVGRRTISATLLSEAESSDDERDIRLEYYVFGRRMEIPVKAS